MLRNAQGFEDSIKAKKLHNSHQHLGITCTHGLAWSSSFSSSALWSCSRSSLYSRPISSFAVISASPACLNFASCALTFLCVRENAGGNGQPLFRFVYGSLLSACTRSQTPRQKNIPVRCLDIFEIKGAVARVSKPGVRSRGKVEAGFRMCWGISTSGSQLFVRAAHTYYMRPLLCDRSFVVVL